jgi:tRNA isopentenyl-2-thiomethyl-A-37 hydroxylase MiaE
MLSLQSASDARWLAQVDAHLDDVLVDHAHCEKKAAGVAMNLLFSYVYHVPLARAMTEIVTEELEHFQQVLALLVGALLHRTMLERAAVDPAWIEWVVDVLVVGVRP